VSCSHVDCPCQIQGCGIEHPADWTPTVHITVNGKPCSGDDAADAIAHYLLSLGYPTDRSEHLRKIAEKMATR
jgi:hypothetical protein